MRLRGRVRFSPADGGGRSDKPVRRSLFLYLSWAAGPVRLAVRAAPGRIGLIEDMGLGHRPLVGLLADRPIDFLAVDAHVRGRLDTQADLVSLHLDDSHGDRLTDANDLPQLPRQNQHGPRAPRGAAVCRSRPRARSSARRSVSRPLFRRAWGAGGRSGSSSFVRSLSAPRARMMSRTSSRRRSATWASASWSTWRSSRQARIALVRNRPTAFRSSHRRPATSPSRRASSRSRLQTCSTSSIPPDPPPDRSSSPARVCPATRYPRIWPRISWRSFRATSLTSARYCPL